MGQAIRSVALIVDDDEQQRASIRILLAETGLEVIEVSSAEAAINMLRVGAHAIILIVTAMQLPSFMDGRRLAAYAAQWPWIRVVVTSVDLHSDDELPYPAVPMPKSWRPLDMLVEAGKAIAFANH
jgi:CheY-like chemotaxis protein